MEAERVAAEEQVRKEAEAEAAAKAEAEPVSSSMRVPSRGAANYLADSMEFHDFCRLGTVTPYAKVIPVQRAKKNLPEPRQRICLTPARVAEVVCLGELPCYPTSQRNARSSSISLASNLQ